MTDDRIIDIFQQHGQYVTPRDYALIRAIAEAVAPQRTWVGLMRGVRVEGDTVVISVKNGNDAARELCGELIKEMNK